MVLPNYNFNPHTGLKTPIETQQITIQPIPYISKEDYIKNEQNKVNNRINDINKEISEREARRIELQKLMDESRGRGGGYVSESQNQAEAIRQLINERQIIQNNISKLGDGYSAYELQREAGNKSYEQIEAQKEQIARNKIARNNQPEIYEKTNTSNTTNISRLYNSITLSQEQLKGVSKGVYEDLLKYGTPSGKDGDITFTQTDYKSKIDDAINNGDIQGYSGTPNLNQKQQAKLNLLVDAGFIEKPEQGTYYQAITPKGQAILNQVSMLNNENLTPEQNLYKNLPKPYEQVEPLKYERPNNTQYEKAMNVASDIVIGQAGQTLSNIKSGKIFDYTQEPYIVTKAIEYYPKFAIPSSFNLNFNAKEHIRYSTLPSEIIKDLIPRNLLQVGLYVATPYILSGGGIIAKGGQAYITYSGTKELINPEATTSQKVIGGSMALLGIYGLAKDFPIAEMERGEFLRIGDKSYRILPEDFVKIDKPKFGKAMFDTSPDLVFKEKLITPNIRKIAIENLEGISREAKPEVLKNFDIVRPEIEIDLTNQVNRLKSGADIINIEKGVPKIVKAPNEPVESVLKIFDKKFEPKPIEIIEKQILRPSEIAKGLKDTLFIEKTPAEFEALVKGSSGYGGGYKNKPFSYNPEIEHLIAVKNSEGITIKEFESKTFHELMHRQTEGLFGDESKYATYGQKPSENFAKAMEKLVDEEGLINFPKEEFGHDYSKSIKQQMKESKNLIEDYYKTKSKPIEFEREITFEEQSQINRLKSGADIIKFDKGEFKIESEQPDLLKSLNKNKPIKSNNQELIMEKPLEKQINPFTSLIEESKESIKQIKYQRLAEKKASIPDSIIKDARISLEQIEKGINEVRYKNQLKSFVEESKLSNAKINYNKPKLIEESIVSESNKLFSDLEQARKPIVKPIQIEPEIEKRFNNQVLESKFAGKGTYERTLSAEDEFMKGSSRNVLILLNKEQMKSNLPNMYVNDRQELKLLSIQGFSELQLTNDAQLSNQAQPQMFKQPQAFAEPQVFAQPQLQIQPQPQLQKFKQKFKQPQEFIQEFNEFNDGFILKNKDEKKRRRIKQVDVYSVLIKRSGKFRPVYTGLTKGKALLMEQDILLRNIARTGRIQKTGTKEVFDEGIEESIGISNKFRQYKVRQGKAISLPFGEIVQRTKYNLQNPLEQASLQQSKRLKKLIGF